MSNPPRFPYSNGPAKSGVFTGWRHAAAVLLVGSVVVVPWWVGLVTIVRWAIL